MIFNFYELIFLNVVGGNVKIFNGWKWENLFIKLKMIKEFCCIILFLIMGYVFIILIFISFLVCKKI